MAQNDPIEALGLGLAADHQAEKQAEKKGRGRKPKADTAEASTDTASEAPASDTPTTDTPAEPATEAVKPEAVTDPQPEPTPAAPGDDRESVMARRLGRLTTIVEDAVFEGGTLFGDVRDCIIDLFQHRPKLWAAMVPSEQKDLIRHVEGVVKALIERVVLVVAEQDSRTLAGTLQPGFTVKGEGAELKIKLDHVDGEVLLDVFNMAGQKVVVVDAADRRFMSQRRAHNIGDDQLDMAFASDAKPIAPPEDAGTIKDAAPAEPEHPADNSDLAGEDAPPVDPAIVDDEDEEEEAQDDARYRIKSKVGEYLIDGEGGDDGWTANVADAGSWPQEEADNLFDEFGGADHVELELVVDTPADD